MTLPRRTVPHRSKRSRNPYAACLLLGTAMATSAWQGAAVAQAVPAGSTAPSAATTPAPTAPVAPPGQVTPPSPSTAAAATTSGPVELILRSPSAAGQPTFAIGKRGNQLLATTCHGKCTWQQANDLGAPPEVVSALSAAHARVLRLARGKTAIHVKIPAQDRHWEALVTATQKALEVPYAGFTGLGPSGDDDRIGVAIEVSDVGKGVQEVVVGELRESLQLCGRQALLAPKVLYPGELKLKGVRMQRLASTERDVAPQLSATHNPNPKLDPLLQVLGASTNASAASALTDADPNTYWSEKRGEDGRGEFVVMRAPKDVPLGQVHFQLRPKAAVGSGYAPPKSLWLVTDALLYHVNFPSEVSADSSASVWSVKLPTPSNTSCLAVVLDEGFSADLDPTLSGAAATPGVAPVAAAKAPSKDGAKPAKEKPSVDVGLAEISAETSWTKAEIEALVQGLSQPATQAVAAQASLRALGAAGYDAVLAKLDSLTAPGQHRAWELLEDAPCERVSRPAVRAFVSGSLGGSVDDTADDLLGEGYGESSSTTPELDAARTIRRCSNEAVADLTLALQRSKAKLTEPVGKLLKELDPVRFTNTAIPLLDGSNAEKRRALRTLLGSALREPKALAASQIWLANPELGTVAVVDLLRTPGPALDTLQPRPVGRALEVLRADPSLRTRYLLAEPLARGVRAEAGAVQPLIQLMRRDPEPMVRARAVSVAPALPALVPSIIAAIDDPAVRVREAAVGAAAQYKLNSARQHLLRHLAVDAWPLVRAASLRALGQLPPGKDVEVAIAEAASADESPEVRRPALVALSNLDAKEQLPVVRERFEEDPDPYVQAAAAATLGQLCDQASADALTAQAQKLMSFGPSERDGIVGNASLAALGRLNPVDLEARLAPFFHPDVPRFVQGAAKAALHQPGACKTQSKSKR